MHDIFDRSVRRQRRSRSEASKQADQWLLTHMADELCDRLMLTSVHFSRALVIGACGEHITSHLKMRGVAVVQCNICATKTATVVCDEDRLPFANDSFDLILACGTLDSVNDLPGALILIRNILRPGGFFLGAMSGAGTLPIMRRAITEAEMSVGRGVAMHIHPQIDVRAAGDLLSRAGFSMPVADQDMITARYSSLAVLVADLRAMGMTNAMTAPAALTKAIVQKAQSYFGAQGDAQGRVGEVFAPLYLTGWCPEIGEAKPSGPVRASSTGMKGISAGGIAKL